MSPLNLSLSDLIANVDTDVPETAALAKVTEAQARSHTLNALGDQLVSHYVAIAKEQGASWTDIGDAIGVSKQAAQQRHTPQVFSRFTNLARHAVILSQESARSHRHDYIGTEHILLGLIEEPRGLAAQLLVEQAGSAQAVRDAAETRMAEGGKKAPRGHIPFTPKAKQSLDDAIRLAGELGHDFIGTEHMLLGLLAGEGIATEALTEQGVNLETMRPRVVAKVAEVLAQPNENTD
jgi:hypothetical protein